MSTTIDQRVVEMRFDNQHFEKNVSTTMSTLDKLKQKLNLPGATKSFSEIDSAAKKVNMTGLGNAVETVTAKFSALQVMGVTALANLTNSAVNAGKRMIKALTIDPITTGFNEYETKINAIQTIMSNTASKGTTMEDVTRVIGELNTYADKTIYNFSEMTRNIGTFTAAGVGLEESAAAIQGIANLAAASGSTSQQASTAMYQLSQALAAGTVKLMDWNSVVNAGMGGEKFQEALKATAREYGIKVDDMIKKNGSFRESLSEGWITADVLNDTLRKFTVEGAKEYADAMVKSGKYTKEQADALIAEAQAMNDAATKVKTFTQLWDTMKESVQSGWGQTWELIIGDFEEAREFLTGLSEMFGGIIEKFSNARNDLLGGALTSNWEKLTTKINEAGVETEVFETKLKDALKSGGHDVDSLIKKHGSLAKIFTSGAVSSDVLKDALKNLGGTSDNTSKKLSGLSKISETLKFGSTGDQVKELQQALIDLGYDLDKYGADGKFKWETFLAVKEFQKAQGIKHDGIVGPKTLAALKEAAGVTDELTESNVKLTGSYDDLVDGIAKVSGRELLLEGLVNIVKSIIDVFRAMGAAWSETFGQIITSEGLYKAIEAFHSFSEGLRIIDDETGEFSETGKKIARTFEGLFAVLDLVTTVLGGPLKLGLKVASWLLGEAGLTILDVTAAIADAIIGFRDFIDSIFEFNVSLDDVKNFCASVMNEITKWLSGAKGMEAGNNVVTGLISGLTSGVSQVWAAAVALAQGIWESFCAFLQIASPSKKMEEGGQYIIQGLVNGLQNGLSSVVGFFKGIADTIIGWIGNINWGSIFAAGVSATMLVTIKKLIDILDAITGPLSGLGDVFEGTGEVLQKSARPIAKILKSTSKAIKSFSKVMNSFAFSIKAKAMKDIAISLAILVGAIALLSFLDAGKLWNAVAIVTVLAVVLGGLAIALNLISKASVTIDKEGAKFSGVTTSLLAIGAAMLLLGITLKLIGDMNVNQAIQGFVGMLGLIGAVALVFLAFGKLVKGDASANISKAGSMMIKMGIALGLMVGVVKLSASLTEADMIQGAKVMAGFTVFVMAMAVANRIAGANVSKIGGTMIKLSIALGLLVGVVKLIGLLTEEEIAQGVKVIGGFMVFVLAMAAIAMIPGTAKLGGMLMGISTSLLIMIGVIKLVSFLSADELKKGALAITAFVGIIFLLTQVVKAAGKDIPKLAGTLIAMSVAIGILAGVAVLLGLVDVEILKRGITAVTILGILVALMIASTKGANDCKGNLIAMTVAIGVLAVAVAALSLIDPEKLVAPTLALSMLMAMFALMAKAAGSAQGAMGSLIVMTVVVGLFGALLYLLSGLPIESTLATAAALSMLLLALAGAMFIISKAGSISLTAMASIGVMVLVVAALAGILGIMSALDCAPSLETALAISTLLIAMAAVYAILGTCGGLATTALTGAAGMMGVIAIIGAIALAIGGLMSLIPSDQIATWKQGFEDFMDFIVILATGLGEAIGGLAGGIMSGISTGIEDISGAIKTLTGVLGPFADEAQKINADVIAGVDNLINLVMKITGASFLEKIASFGGSSMDTFATQIVAFGGAMRDYAAEVTGIDTTSIASSVTAANSLVAVAQAIPEDGFLGLDGIDDFGRNIVTFGKSMRKYAEEVAGIDVLAVSTSVAAAQGLVAVANLIPDDGALGTDGIDDFGRNIVTFGGKIQAYAEKVTGLDTTAITTSVSSARSIANFVTSLVGLDASGIENFKIASLGTAISKYASKVAEVNTVAILSSITAATMVRNFVTSLAGMDSSGVFAFNSAVNQLATTNVNGIVAAFEGAGSKLAAVGMNMMMHLANGIAVGSAPVLANAMSVMDLLSNSISVKLVMFQANGIEVMSRFINGMVSQRARALSSVASIALAAANRGRSYYSSFYNAGGYLVQGFANGITANTFLAEARARAMANAAYQAAMNELNARSPSRLFMEVGSYVSSGFAIGIEQGETEVKQSSAHMANTAIASAKTALSKLGDAVSNGIDTQPTIRPVLDLSQVQNGVAQLDGMFNDRSMALATTNASGFGNRAMSTNASLERLSKMNESSNREVVSAIAELRSDFGSLVSAINGMHIRMDSGTVVGELVGKIDRSLGQIAMHKGRGS